jgi:hypothetical protein
MHIEGHDEPTQYSVTAECTTDALLKKGIAIKQAKSYDSSSLQQCLLFVAIHSRSSKPNGSLTTARKTSSLNKSFTSGSRALGAEAGTTATGTETSVPAVLVGGDGSLES